MRMKRLICAALAAAMTLGAAALAPEVAAEYAADVSPAIEIIRGKTKMYKALAPLSETGFGREDFSRLLGGSAEHVVLLTLPVNGSLRLNGVELKTNQPIKADMLSGLSYVSGANEGTDRFTFKDAGQTNSSALECVITVCADPTAPDCPDLELKTYRDVMIGVELGEKEVEIVSAPPRGMLTLSGGKAVYRPQTGFEGRDSFTYRITEGGLVSREATVSVTVEKPYENLFFADMADSTEHREAIDLYRFTSLEPETDDHANCVFDPDAAVSAQEAQRALREADPKAEEPVLLLPDETMTRMELARLVSRRAREGEDRQKDFFGRLMEFFGG